MEDLIKAILDNLVHILALVVLSLGSSSLAKFKRYIVSKTSEKQYEFMSQIARDIYEYVEREYWHEKGPEKLKYAMELFDKQMEKLNLPYTSDDFKLQVEKIIRQEKLKR